MIVHYHTVHFHVPRAAIICVTVMDAKLVSVEVFAVRPISPFSTIFSFSFVFTCSSPLNNYWLLQGTTGYWPIPFSSNEALQIGCSMRILLFLMLRNWRKKLSKPFSKKEKKNFFYEKSDQFPYNGGHWCGSPPAQKLLFSVSDNNLFWDNRSVC